MTDIQTTDRGPGRRTAAPDAGPPSPEERAAQALTARSATPRPPDAVEAGTPEPPAGADGGRPGRRAARTVPGDGTLVGMPQAARDLVLLLARLVLGAVLVAHGLQKVAVGAPGTAEGFGQLGIPQPGAAAVFTMVAETGGGLLLLLGALTPLAALLPAVVMAGALPLHVGRGVFVTDGGWELAATVGAGLLVIAVVGPGRVSVDGLVSRARRRRAAVATASTPGSTGG